MKNDIFGRNWSSPFKQLYWLLLATLVGSFVFFIVAWILGYSSSISWNVIAQGESIPFTLDNFNIGTFKLPVVVDAYLLTERHNGTPLELHTIPTYIFAGLLAFLFTILVSFISTLKRFWYIVAMGLVIIFLTIFQMDQLQLFNRFDKTTLIISFVFYLPLSYYFHAIRPNTNFQIRIIGFGVVTALFGLLIYFFAEVDRPFLYLVTYGYAAPIILSFLFILLVGAEIIAGFVYVITRSSITTGKNSNLFHLSVITVIYLVNLSLVFLHDLHYLSWRLNFISPFALLAISATIGFFMYHKKENTYENIYKYRPTGAVIYVVLATICFFTIAYHINSANDPVVEVFKKFIYYSHLGYGLIFFIYILSSFRTHLQKGVQVYKILYKPQSMPFFTYRFAGTIAVVALFLSTNYEVPLFATFSSYYNGIGDLHVINNEDKIAEAYYINGNIYGYNSHRSSYALASLALKNNDRQAESHYYAKAIQNRPSEQAFVNLSNAYVDDNKPFEAIFTLQNGLKKYPTSARIKNNLALLFYKVAEIDSAFSEVLEALKSSATSATAGVNMLSFIAKGDYAYNIDSLIVEYADRNYLASMSNIKVLYNINNTFDYNNVTQIDSSLNLLTAYEVYNSELNKVFGDDTIQANYLMNLSYRWENGYWNEMLVFAAAIGNYYNRNVSKSIELLNTLATNNYYKAGYYYNMLGLVCLNEGAPRLAIDYFKKANYYEYKDAQLNLAIALSEAEIDTEAIPIWEEIKNGKNAEHQNMAIKMLGFYEDETLKDSDMSIYWKWKYSASKTNDMKNIIVFDMLKTSVYKDQLLLDLVEYQFKNANYSQASLTIGKINDHEILKQESYNELQLQIADTENNTPFLKNAIAARTSNRSDRLKNSYYEMRVAELSGDTATAQTLIIEFKNKNPFFENGVIGLANYYQNHDDSMEAYSTLLKAIELNKYSVRLLKAYIKQCARLDFDNYAEYELERIQEFIPRQDYILLLDEYNMLLAETRVKFEND